MTLAENVNSRAQASTQSYPAAFATLDANPTPKPRVAGKKRKWGATLKATQQTRRLGEGKPSKPISRPTKPQISTVRKFIPTSVARRRPFRLNIGICGMKEQDESVPGPSRCQPVEPVRRDPRVPRPTTEVVQPPRPEDVNWEEVLQESKNVAFPGRRVKVQPAGRTLVNLDTIVYTDHDEVTTATVSLLGFPVVVEASPVSYTWDFGDGTKVTTTSPGKPYPAKDVTHKYVKKADVSVVLTTNYAARFNVAGTGWQYVDGTVPITGPGTPLQVREAVPVLVDPPN
ncbi:PKD domain-containing protein [Kribbella caucasensis]|uniref:PKD domain-containing protein n=1 Tax=Kribbella caucasensis TaxID=2512215 RepID=UPI00105CC08A|nr:PKD domain-containing protein [Kribbella sp. VKM Ac-2527]